MKPTSFSLFLLAFTFSLCCHSRDNPQYEGLKQKIAATQKQFATRYANSAATQKEVVQEAQAYLTTTITDSLFSYWYGTPWSFNGTTRVPRQGTIACGYFVTTILSDAGFKIPRVKWAQSASEPVVVKIASNIKRFRNQPVSKVIEYLNNQGDGLYIIGLDYHIGFVSKFGNKHRFIHSGFYHPEIGVMAEPLEGHNPLNDSSYRVIGKLLGPEMVKNWINGVDYDLPVR
jgi:hypothetical protein